MDKINELTKSQKDEDKILIAKIEDKINFANSRSRPEHSDFFDMAQQALIQPIVDKHKEVKNIFFGGYDGSERKMLFMIPEEIEFSSKIYNQAIKVCRITLPKEQYGQYEHKTYLGALMKLGIKREKVGDILVRPDGADILISVEVQNFLEQNIQGLTRFQKADIQMVEVENLKYEEKPKKIFKINVPSMRLDCIVGELAKCSRTVAVELIKQERVFVDFKEELVPSKNVKEGSYVTIRGKGGRFRINRIIGETRSKRLNVEVEQ